MPQALLPLIPDGATQVNTLVSIVREDGQWTYFVGVMPVFVHREDDRRSFRMFTAQLVCQGTCRVTEIVQMFGVSKNSVLRSTEKFRKVGVEGFFAPRRGRGPTVMTDEAIAKAQELLKRGSSREEVAEELDIKYDTLRKAINQGRLLEPPCAVDAVPIVAALDRGENEASDKSDRSMEDATAAERAGNGLHAAGGTGGSRLGTPPRRPETF